MEEIKMLSVDDIKPNPQQPRKSFDEEKLKALAETYRNQGVIQPIEVDENYQIITGERRWRAAKIAGLKEIPCKIIKGLSEEEKLERQLIENIHHEPLSDIDKARAIKKLMEMKGWSVLRAARNLGIHHKTLQHLLALVEAPEPIKKLVEENKLPPTDAGEIAYRLKDKPDKAVEIAKRVARSTSNKRKLVRALIKEHKLKEKPLKMPEDKFNVIYADPPWKYDFSRDFARSIPSHYPAMDLEELKALGSKIPFADDCVLFLWATSPKLEEAFEVIRAWGFVYKTNFVWVKDKIGMGYYCRNKHEILLVATRGNMSPPPPESRFPSVITAPREEHSKKPEIVYEMIEKMYPDGKYLELFARNKREKWVGWGAEYGQI